MMRFLRYILALLLSQVLFSQEIDEIINNLNSEQIESILDNSSLEDKDIDDINFEETLAEIDLKSEQSEISNSAEQEPMIFGHDFVKTYPTNIDSSSNLPVPNDYVVSLNDSYRIMLSGTQNASYTLKVNLDGTVFFPELGSLFVLGDKYEDFVRKLENLVYESYVGVNIDVGVADLSAKKINILGAVKFPGTYLVSPFTTVSSSLAFSGGLEDYSSIRNITVMRQGAKLNYDLYDLLIYGDRTNDFYLQQGDTVFINSTNKTIEIKGNVNRPRIYEYKKNESLKDLIFFAMGFKKNSNEHEIAIIDYNRSLNERKVELLDFKSNNPMSQFNSPENIEVFELKSSPELMPKIMGPVEKPGFIKIDNNKKLNLSELIQKTDFTSELNPYIGIIQEGNNSFLFSVKDKQTQDFDLDKNYEIIFFSKNENILENKNLSNNSLQLIKAFSLQIHLNEEKLAFPFFGKVKLSEIIDFLGLDISGVFSEIVSYVSPTRDFTKSDLIDDLTFEAEKYNQLLFIPLLQKTITVEVSGEVARPGKFIFESGTSLANLYEFVGGTTDNADADAVIFSRQKLQEKNEQLIADSKKKMNELLLLSNDEIDPALSELLEISPEKDQLGRISGDLSINSDGVENFFLEDGDKIFIPKKISTISVIGEVMQPSTYIYSDNLRLNDLIEMAGGYTQQALRKSVYVIRSNGSIDKYGSFFSRNLKIYPGDTVIVPVNYRFDQNLIEQLAPITNILSNLAFSAAAIDNLKQ